MNIGSSLSPIRLSRYTPTMSICSTKNPKSADMARKILKDSRCTVGANVSLKSMLGI